MRDTGRMIYFMCLIGLYTAAPHNPERIMGR